MSAGSKKSSTLSSPTLSSLTKISRAAKRPAQRTNPAIKRGAFSPAIWKTARKTAAEYQIILSCEENEWFGRGLELPNVFGDGPTAETCVASTRDALGVAR